MRSLLLIIFISTSLGLLAQKATINGTIKDDKTGENLIGASIYNMRRLQGATTNSYGFYSITQPMIQSF